ncbi:MAG: iron hydrogenase small subunit [Burkholderiales bacterium]|nr:iron hydrogenase small subunit [Burkholderiales bacterium]
MACPGGCINGGGTPREKGDYHYNTALRAHVLDASDKANKIRQSHNNPEVQLLYKDYLEKPNSHKAHELLHTHYTDRKPKKKPEPINDVWQKITLV